MNRETKQMNGLEIEAYIVAEMMNIMILTKEYMVDFHLTHFSTYREKIFYKSAQIPTSKKQK